MGPRGAVCFRRRWGRRGFAAFHWPWASAMTARLEPTKFHHRMVPRKAPPGARDPRIRAQEAQVVPAASEIGESSVAKRPPANPALAAERNEVHSKRLPGRGVRVVGTVLAMSRPSRGEWTREAQRGRHRFRPARSGGPSPEPAGNTDDGRNRCAVLLSGGRRSQSCAACRR